MKKNYKIIFMIIAVLLVFVSVIAIAYGQINIHKSKSAILDDDTYLTAAEEGVEMCKEYSSVLDDSTEYDDTLKYYIDNINDTSSPQLKAYIAGNMVTYALNYFSQKSVEFEAKLTQNGAISPYLEILEALGEKQIELQNLI